MRLMAASATWPQVVNTDPDVGPTQSVTRRVKVVWFDGERFYPTRRLAAARGDQIRKIWMPAWWDHAEGKPTLKPGEVFEFVQWSPRIGPRWCCSCRPRLVDCGFVGGKASTNLVSEVKGLRQGAPECRCGNDLEARLPRRGILARHIETRIVKLGEPLNWSMAEGQAEAAREGFPDMCWDAFLEQCFPGVPPDSKVSRIEFVRA